MSPLPPKNRKLLLISGIKHELVALKRMCVIKTLTLTALGILIANDVRHAHLLNLVKALCFLCNGVHSCINCVF